MAPQVHLPLYTSFLTEMPPHPSRQEAYVIRDYPLTNIYMFVFLGVAFANFHSVMPPRCPCDVTEHRVERDVPSGVQDTVCVGNLLYVICMFNYR